MLNKDYKIKLGKFLSLILRHKPETIGIKLDNNGWADVNKLIKGVKEQNWIIDKNILEEIVSTNDKQRYSFNENHTKIRANQGHSINVDVELKEMEPPEYLLHGTAERFSGSIRKLGLKPQSRLHVHLTEDRDLAIKNGSRYGKPEVLVIESSTMYEDGYKFYKSENNVWLTEFVPRKYIQNL